MSVSDLRTLAQADQAQAAANEATRLVHQVAARGNGTLGHTLSPWLAHRVVALADAMLNGQARACPHISSAPCLVFTALWAPGILTCRHCAHLLTPTPAEDNTCDHCRRSTNHIHPCMAAAGPVLIAYGLCGPCHTNLQPTRTASRGRAR